MAVLLRAMLLSLLISGIAACSKTPARLPGPVAVLDIPAPPVRVTVPVQLPEPEEEPPAPAPTAVAIAPARPRADASTAPRPERPTAAPATATTNNDGPSQVLQTTAAVGQVEQRTRSLLDEAQKRLDMLSPRTLGAKARAQYDSAVGFIRNAQKALTIRNYMYAEQLAVKAASLARELARG